MTLPSGTALKEKDVIKLRRIFEDYRESGALNALVNIHLAAAENIFLTKSGDLVSFLAVDGRDYECLDAFQLDAVARGFQSAVQHFDSKFTIYQYLLKNDHPIIGAGESHRPIVQEALDARAAYLTAKAASLYSLDTYIAVVYHPESAVDSFGVKLRQALKAPRLTARQLLSTRLDRVATTAVLPRQS